MKKITLKYFLSITVSFICSISILADTGDPGTTSSLSSYKLAPGDALEVSVWKEEDLQKQVILAPDGTISLPLVGSITAAGKTIAEIQQIIAEKLNSYISDPSVTVSLLKNDGNTIFVVGKVNKPGQFLVNRYIDVLQALSLAGGLTVFANESSIHILRRTTGGEIKVFPFDYDDVLDGENLDQNITLEPGDTVTVR